jgi:hypothetical protein
MQTQRIERQLIERPTFSCKIYLDDNPYMREQASRVGTRRGNDTSIRAGRDRQNPRQWRDGARIVQGTPAQSIVTRAAPIECLGVTLASLEAPACADGFSTLAGTAVLQR